MPFLLFKGHRNLSHHAKKLAMTWPKVHTHRDMFCISHGFQEILSMHIPESLWDLWGTVESGNFLSLSDFLFCPVVCAYWLSGRAGRENIWPEVMAYGPSAARSMHHTYIISFNKHFIIIDNGAFLFFFFFGYDKICYRNVHLRHSFRLKSRELYSNKVISVHISQRAACSLSRLDDAFRMDPEWFWCTKYTHMWIFGISTCFSISFFKQNNY